MRDELWTPELVAERWRVKPRTVSDMLRDGRLKGFKIGRVWRVYLSEVMRVEEAGVPKRDETGRVEPMPKPIVKGISL